MSKQPSAEKVAVKRHIQFVAACADQLLQNERERVKVKRARKKVEATEKRHP